MADELVVFDVEQRRNARAHKYCYYLLLKNYDRTIKLASILPSKMRALRFLGSDELDIRSGAFSFAKCLRTLDFSECSGIMLPASIGRLKQLRCLIAPRMQNESLPECITELPKLQYLNINGSSQVSALPESIGKLGCLKYLCLSGCSGISKLPESFGHLKSMVHLDMSGCYGIIALPKCITELSKLQYLNIHGTSKITELPESIGNLGCLKYLCLSGCFGISKLPESFGDLKCMVHLDMSGCSGLTELPDSLGNLTHLQHLELSGCSSVKAIHESLCGITQLQYLNLSSCACLEGLPAGIGSLVDLRHLYMSDCEQIKELPESLMKLQSLSHLNLSGCRRIQKGSLAVLRGLTAMQHLDISNLGVSYHKDLLDDFIATFTNLENLDLSCNFNLAYLPESIGNLKRLRTLDLSGCRWLKFLPESIGALGLKSLVLDGCSDVLIDQASSLVNFSQTLPVFKVRADEVNGCSNLHQLKGIHVSELRIRSLENVMSLEEANKVKLTDKHNLTKLTLAWSTKRAVQNLEDQDLLEQLVPPTGLKSLCLKGYSSTSFPGWLTCIYHHLTNLISIQLRDMPTCSNLPPLGQLPHLENVVLWNLPVIKRIDWEFCGGNGAFRRLSSFEVSHMSGLEEWNTTYSVEDGVEEFMFPVLDHLQIQCCRRLRLKPCPPTFRECIIHGSDQVISSLEEVDITSHHYSSSSRAIKLDLAINGDSCKSIRLFHHFPALRDVRIKGAGLTSLPESMRHLTCLESLRLHWCYGISGLPEWLGDLSCLKSLAIEGCRSIQSLPSCIQQLTKLQKLEIRNSPELNWWCESEENKAKLAHINVKVSSLPNYTCCFFPAN
jgi:Leucine-rich repeat (LRR) protein